MKNFFWFRRDLRIQDNAGLYHALKSGKDVQPVFIFDQNILTKLSDRSDARVSFIHETITALDESLKSFGEDFGSIMESRIKFGPSY